MHNDVRIERRVSGRSCTNSLSKKWCFHCSVRGASLSGFSRRAYVAAHGWVCHALRHAGQCCGTLDWMGYAASSGSAEPVGIAAIFAGGISIMIGSIGRPFLTTPLDDPPVVISGCPIRPYPPGTQDLVAVAAPDPPRRIRRRADCPRHRTSCTSTTRPSQP